MNPFCVIDKNVNMVRHSHLIKSKKLYHSQAIFLSNVDPKIGFKKINVNFIALTMQTKILVFWGCYKL